MFVVDEKNAPGLRVSLRLLQGCHYLCAQWLGIGQPGWKPRRRRTKKSRRRRGRKKETSKVTNEKKPGTRFLSSKFHFDELGKKMCTILESNQISVSYQPTNSTLKLRVSSRPKKSKKFISNKNAKRNSKAFLLIFKWSVIKGFL
jgi:hypothetical protein